VAKAKGLGNPFALSRKSGLNYAICYRLWHEQTTLISLPTLTKLCDTLECKPGELFDYVKSSGKKKRGNK
jgi:DNA-binding Xre family transcriptional regulator